MKRLGMFLLAVPLLMSLFLVASGPTAFAATSPARVSASAPRPTQLIGIPITTSVVAAPLNNTGDPCKTASRQQNTKDRLGITLFWFKMQTRWCWDNRTVTSHQTTISWGVTDPGAAVGWAYISNSGIRFNCYVASGSTRQCSGNHEYAIASFHNVVTRQVCLPRIDEWQNYKGQFFSSGNSC